MPSTPSRPSHPRARLAAGLASAALLLAPAAAAHADGVVAGPDFAVSAQNAGVAVAEAPDGSSFAAWVDTSAGDGGGTLMFQHAAPDGTVGAPVPLGPANPGAQAPVIATGASGSGAVAWSEPEDGGQVKLAVVTFGADGARHATAELPGSSDYEQTSIAVDGSGNAVLAWVNEGSGFQATTVSADGTVAAQPLFADGSRPNALTDGVAVTPAGVAWVGWVDGGGTAQVVRLVPGAAPSAPATLTNDETTTDSVLSLAASAAGGVATWSDGQMVNPSDSSTADNPGAVPAAVRLPVSGDAIAGDRLQFGAEPSTSYTTPAAAIGPDGAITVAWSKTSGLGPGGVLDPSDLPTATVMVNRFAPGAASAPPQDVAQAPQGHLDAVGGVDSGPDGSVLLDWLDVDIAAALSHPMAPIAASVVARRFAPDGTVGPAVAAGQVQQANGFDPTSAVTDAVVSADQVGGGLIGLVSGGSDGASLSTKVFVGAPALTADVPTTAVAGMPVTLTANATDRVAVQGYGWNFGDGTGGAAQPSVQHVFTAPGTYTVTATATDTLGTTSTVTKQITVTVPVGSHGPAPVHLLPPPKKTPAHLKLGKASRTGTKVTVNGTIAKRAGGKVTIAYAEKIGRKTVTKKVTARIKKSRWSVSFRLTGKLATKAALRGKASVTVSYAGDADTAKASAKNAVRVVKPKPKKNAKPHGRR